MISKEKLIVYKSLIKTVRDTPKFMHIKKNNIYKIKIQEYTKNYKNNNHNKILYKKPNKKEMVGEYNEY